MARQSTLERHEPFIAAAVLTAHGINLKKGFRQVEVRWYLELFANWIELMGETTGFLVQNTQVARYLKTLLEDGYARQMKSGKHPMYLLTRPGLMEVVSRLVNQPFFGRREYFFFVFFFIKAYRVRLIKMVQMQGKSMPYATQMELDALLDADLLLDNQIAHVQQEISKFDKRLSEQQRSLELAMGLIKNGKDYTDVVSEIDQRFPFSLDPHRRYSELYAKGTEKQRSWELTLGTKSRLTYLWLPARRMLQHYLDELEALKSNKDKGVS